MLKMNEFLFGNINDLG